MKSELTAGTGCQKTLKIEIPREAVEKEINEIAGAIAKTARVPGFRPGRTPIGVIRSRYRDEITKDLNQRLLPHYFSHAIDDHKLSVVLHSEQVDGEPRRDGEPMRYTITFEVYPELSITNYTGVPVPAISTAVEDAEIDEQLERLREDRAELIPVEDSRAIRTHDFVDIAFVKVEGAPSENFPPTATVEVGGASTLKEFTENLDGIHVGDEVSFSIAYPENYPAQPLAGRTVQFTVRAEGVKQRQVPELTDEFAESIGQFTSLDDLKARLRQDMAVYKQGQARERRRDGLIKWLEEQNAFDVPKTLVDHQAQHRMRKLARDFERQKIDPRRLDIDWVKLYEQQQQMALRDVKGTLILDHIAEVEKIEVTDEEVQREIDRMAQEADQPPQKIRGILEKNSGLDQLKTDIQRRKTLDLIEERSIAA